MRKKRRPGYARKQQTLPLQSPQKNPGPGKPARTKKEPPDKRRACRRRASNAQSAAGARTLADEPARTGYGGPARAGPGDTEATKPAKAAGAASTIRHVQESCLGCEKSKRRACRRRGPGSRRAGRYGSAGTVRRTGTKPAGSNQMQDGQRSEPCSNMNGWAEYGRSAARSRQGNVRKSR